MPSIAALAPACTAAALGVALLIVAIVGEPPRRRCGPGAWLVCALGFAIGAVALVQLLSLGRPLAAVGAGGVALAGAAGVIALMRAGPGRDDDDDGGRGYEPIEPPSDPGGIIVDWDEFERALWSYVGAQERVRT